MSTRPRTAISFTLILLILLGSAPMAREQDAPPSEKELGKAVRRAVDYLHRTVPRLPEISGTPRKPFVLATAGLVHLASPGASTGTDPVPGIVKGLLRWLDRTVSRTGEQEELPDRHGSFSSRNLIQYTWPAAQAGIYFSELYLRGRHREEARRGMALAVRLLEESQDANGGWGHGKTRKRGSTEPAPAGPQRSLGGYPATLLAASNCAATAMGLMKATRRRGTGESIERARGYYRKARLPNGNFPYDPSQRSSGGSLTGVGRTGGALLAMYFLGVPRTDPDVAGSLGFVTDRMDYLSEGHGSSTLNLTHSAFALRLIDKTAFERFKKIYFGRILAGQQEDGSFRCVCEKKAFGTTCDSGTFGGDLFRESQDAYVTSLLTLVLLLDRGDLKVLGKKPIPAPRRTPTTRDPR